MPIDEGTADRMVTALVPSLSRSLAEQFNVFRVMHHGTHEKQLSNVFAWLLRADATHGLGDAFQRIFVEQVNAARPDTPPLPATGYRVAQEVDTSGPDAAGKDIADIVMTSDSARIVIENFETSDGHGHDYEKYLATATTTSRTGIVVMLCARVEPHRLRRGWENAVVVTYRDLIEPLATLASADRAWKRAHPEQQFFIGQMVDQFVEGAAVTDADETIAFIKAMCDTGESARYGQRPQEAAAVEFGELLAAHAKRQFEDSRKTLGAIKRALKRYAEQTLVNQVNAHLDRGRIVKVETRFQGVYEWCVTLRRADDASTLYLTFGPTTVMENSRLATPLEAPDYSRVFVARAKKGDISDLLIQTAVPLTEVLAGTPDDDTRILDSLLAAIAAD